MHTQVGRGKMTLLGFALKKTSAKEKNKTKLQMNHLWHIETVACGWWHLGVHFIFSNFVYAWSFLTVTFHQIIFQTVIVLVIQHESGDVLVFRTKPCEGSLAEARVPPAKRTRAPRHHAGQRSARFLRGWIRQLTPCAPRLGAPRSSIWKRRTRGSRRRLGEPRHTPLQGLRPG